MWSDTVVTYTSLLCFGVYHPNGYPETWAEPCQFWVCLYSHFSSTGPPLPLILLLKGLRLHLANWLPMAQAQKLCFTLWLLWTGCHTQSPAQTPLAQQCCPAPVHKHDAQSLLRCHSPLCSCQHPLLHTGYRRSTFPLHLLAGIKCKRRDLYSLECIWSCGGTFPVRQYWLPVIYLHFKTMNWYPASQETNQACVCVPTHMLAKLQYLRSFTPMALQLL